MQASTIHGNDDSKATRSLARTGEIKVEIINVLGTQGNLHMYRVELESNQFGDLGRLVDKARRLTDLPSSYDGSAKRELIVREIQTYSMSGENVVDFMVEKKFQHGANRMLIRARFKEGSKTLLESDPILDANYSIPVYPNEQRADVAAQVIMKQFAEYLVKA